MTIQIKPKTPLYRGQAGLIATGRPIVDLNEVKRIKTSPHYQNLLKTFSSASQATIDEGKLWYRSANLFATSLSQRFNVTLDQAASVIATLSPASRWERNLQDAENLIKAYYHRGYIGALPVTVSTYGFNKIKSLGILSRQIELTPKTGLKTWNFKNNIVDPNNPDFVTIDRHAHRVLTGDTNNGAVNLNLRQYQLSVSVYKTLAQEVKLVPCELQAIAWLQYKQSLNYNQSFQTE
jgi:hypothetical protein